MPTMGKFLGQDTLTKYSKINGLPLSSYSKFLGMDMPASSAAGWLNWDESAEVGCATDDIFCCMMENVNAGGDETGQGGGLTGANLVLTQAGNIAGATGSPARRALDGSGDYFSMTTAAIDALIGNANNTWSIVIKALFTDRAAAAQLFWLGQTGYDEVIRCSVNTNQKVVFNTIQDDTGDNVTTTDALSNSTVYYFAIWTDGTDLRCGFSTTRPTKWSDFGANDRGIFGTNTGAYSGESFTHSKNIFSYESTYEPWLGAGYYVVMSKTCLIDNAS